MHNIIYILVVIGVTDINTYSPIKLISYALLPNHIRSVTAIWNTDLKHFERNIILNSIAQSMFSISSLPD